MTAMLECVEFLQLVAVDGQFKLHSLAPVTVLEISEQIQLERVESDITPLSQNKQTLITVRYPDVLQFLCVLEHSIDITSSNITVKFSDGDMAFHLLFPLPSDPESALNAILDNEVAFCTPYSDNFPLISQLRKGRHVAIELAEVVTK